MTPLTTAIGLLAHHAHHHAICALALKQGDTGTAREAAARRRHEAEAARYMADLDGLRRFRNELARLAGATATEQEGGA